jgi:hypothetical protein
MLRTFAAVLIAASMSTAPAFAQGTSPTPSAPSAPATQSVKAPAVKIVKAKKHHKSMKKHVRHVRHHARHAAVKRTHAADVVRSAPKASTN